MVEREAALTNHLKTTSAEELVRGLRREKVNVLVPMAFPRGKAAFLIPGSLQLLVGKLDVQDRRGGEAGKNLVESGGGIGNMLEHLGKDDKVVGNTFDLIWMDDGRSMLERLGTKIEDVKSLLSCPERCVDSCIPAPVKD
jgi:hypothetical protein